MKLYKNGNIISMNKNNPFPESVLTNNGIIVEIGKEKDLTQYADEIIDLNGLTMLPAFIDSHSHITAYAYQLLMVNLSPSPTGNCDTVDNIIDEFKKKLNSATKNEWFVGMGYDDTAMKDGKFLTKYDLDKVSTQIPIAAMYASGHLCVVNSKGMELLGYTGDYTVPAGGEVSDNGILKEMAFLSPEKQKIMRGPSSKATMDAIKKACDIYKSRGILTAQDGKTTNIEYRLLEYANESNLLDIDIVMYLDPSLAETMLPRQNPAQNKYNGHLRFGGVKIFLDGSPQGKTAWLSKPYHVVPKGQSPAYCGFPVLDNNYVLDIMRKCLVNNWQINVHANGDNAIEQMIVTFEKAQKQAENYFNLRPVIIHCQTVRPDQLERMKKLNIMPSYFSDHVYYWGDYHYSSVLGPERAEKISPIKSTIDLDIPFTIHRDTPVLAPNVIESIHNAVNRVTKRGRVLGESEKITAYDALKAVTINAAYQIFEANKKGSIQKGKNAQFVLLDQNPLTVDETEIKNINVVGVINGD